MALTAARTELNVSLVGEDETIRMIEDAKKRMGELEAKTRSLTGATQAQTQAAKAQQAATSGVNDMLGRLGGAIAKPLDGIGKLKEAISKGIEVFGFLGAGVNGAITAFDFLSDAFGNGQEEAAKLTAALDAQKKQLDATKKAAADYRDVIASLNKTAAGAAVGAANDAIELAKLQGNLERAAQLTAESKIKQSADAVEKTKAEYKAAVEQGDKAAADAKKFNEQSKKEIDVLLRKEVEIKSLKRQGRIEDANAARAEYTALLSRNNESQAALKAANAAVEASKNTADELLGQQIIQQQITFELEKQQKTAAATTKEVKEQNKEKEKPAKPRGGGGGGGKRQPEEDPEEVARREAMLLRAEADEIARVVKALYEEQQAREANEAAMLSATKLMRDEVGTTLPALRQQMMRDLAALPGGELFESIRKQLQEQVKAVDAQMGDLRALANVEDADLLAQATDKQVQALDKLQESYLNLGEAKAKALEESIKLREELERGEIAGSVNQFSEALQQLGQMQAPVFEVVTESLAGINAQMGKFKEGQQSLTTAIVGSAGAIAGAVGKKIDNVKLEAGIRALFETAMGFATLGNPAESVGHFTAAAMFGLVAGGVIPTTSKSGKDGGGSKAPAKTEAKSRDSMMGGGGGQVTNVYNLQTGIVDGQSTAQAFRRAEMQARNTGMASAGGW
jgi:hypothetical protein